MPLFTGRGYPATTGAVDHSWNTLVYRRHPALRNGIPVMRVLGLSRTQSRHDCAGVGLSRSLMVW